MTVVDFTTGANSGHTSFGTQTCGAAAGAADFPDSQGAGDTHRYTAAGEHDSQPTSRGPTPKMKASAGSDFPDSQCSCDTQEPPAVGEHNPPALAKVRTSPNDRSPVLASSSWADSNAPLLALLADALDDIENMRTATANRLRQLTRTEADKDGEERGFGLTLDQPQVATVAAMVKALKHDDKVLKELGYDTKAIGRPCSCLECSAIRNLEKAVSKHPLGPWVKATLGVGEKQGARLFAAIGDPYWNTLHDRPRLVSELWAYCGLHVLPTAHVIHDPHEKLGGGGKQGDSDHGSCDTHSSGAGVAPSRARGQRANWSTTAKTRAYLIAESCIKQARSSYRVVYDDGRRKYADSVHQTPCRRCGPSGRPAETGTLLSAGHQHARAMRLVMKEILKGLWLESKRLHDQAGSAS